MIQLDDLEKCYDQASSFDVSEMLEAWEIDADAFAVFSQKLSDSGLRDVVRSRNPRLSLLTMFVIGFEMGYKMSLEAELRRAADA